MSGGSGGLWQIVLGWVPTLVWASVIVTALLVLKAPLRDLIPRVEKVSAAGVDVSFTAAQLSAAAKAKDLKLPAPDTRGVARRAAEQTDLLRRARVVWLDPVLENIEPELNAFRSLGLQIKVTNTVVDAVAAAISNPDIVITNYGKDAPGGPNALQLVAGLRKQGLRIPVLVYTKGIDEDKQSTPGGVFAQTTRPDRLLHYVIDALEHGRH